MVKSEIINKLILSDPAIGSINSKNIITYPLMAWESTIRKAAKNISVLPNFESVIEENSIYKLHIKYKAVVIDWGTMTFLRPGGFQDLDSLMFPRNLCYDVPIKDLIKIPFLITGERDGGIRTELDYYTPTFSFLPSGLIQVDLQIIDCLGDSPESRGYFYWETLLDILFRTPNTLKRQYPIPDIDGNGYTKSLLFSFLLENKFFTLGDLRLAIDEFMEKLDSEIKNNI